MNKIGRPELGLRKKENKLNLHIFDDDQDHDLAIN